MSYCLTLKPACVGCGSQSDLYGSSCKHMTLCLKCGKTMAENKAKCLDCGTIVTRLIRVRDSCPFHSSLIQFCSSSEIVCLVILFRNTMSVQAQRPIRTTSLVDL